MKAGIHPDYYQATVTMIVADQGPEILETFYGYIK